MSILDSRDVTPEERRAIDDVERPGVWRWRNPEPAQLRRLRRVQQERHVERVGDVDEHALTQHETDMLICAELWQRLGVGMLCQQPIYDSILGPHRVVSITVAYQPDTSSTVQTRQVLAYEQRGGIHSDPLVRLLAYRTWGERDRIWGFARRMSTSLPFTVEGPDRKHDVRSAFVNWTRSGAGRMWMAVPPWSMMDERRVCTGCDVALHRHDCYESNVFVGIGSMVVEGRNVVCSLCHDAVMSPSARDHLPAEKVRQLEMNDARMRRAYVGRQP